MSTDNDAALRRKYREAVGALPRKQREVFFSHLVEQLPYDQIAEIKGITIREVERQMARAIYKIAKQMDGEPLSWFERSF